MAISPNPIRIQVIGNSGTGKTTVAKALAERFNLPYISLDSIWFKPHWVELEREEFRARVLEITARYPGGWVADGNYTRKLGGVLDGHLTHLIWMDLPFWKYYPRLVYRTLLGLFGLVEPCAPQCYENWRLVFFSRESILWCAAVQHWRTRSECESRCAKVQDMRNGCTIMRICSESDLDNLAWL